LRGKPRAALGGSAQRGGGRVSAVAIFRHEGMLNDRPWATHIWYNDRSSHPDGGKWVDEVSMGNPFDSISDSNEIKRLRREAAEREWRSAVDRLIDEAQKKGAFDNLPGQGQPLDLKKNPYSAEKALAYELLQNNNYTLPWIADRNELLKKIAGFRQELLRLWRRQQARAQGASDPVRAAALDQEWSRLVEEMSERLRELNQEIADLNLISPVSRLEILKLNLDKELERIGAPPP
jgi:hypothetical protein